VLRPDWPCPQLHYNLLDYNDKPVNNQLADIGGVAITFDAVGQALPATGRERRTMKRIQEPADMVRRSNDDTEGRLSCAIW
jgi:hypothetical protein